MLTSSLKDVDIAQQTVAMYVQIKTISDKYAYNYIWQPLAR